MNWSEGFVSLLLLATMAYSRLIFLLRNTWDQETRNSDAAFPPEPQTGFSILVPFRNERDNLPGLIRSLSELDYPVELFECILIDDHSTDGGPLGLVHPQAPEIRLISNDRGEGKKSALEAGVASARFAWILTTDADVTLPSAWLRSLDACIRKQQADLVAASVCSPPQRTWLSWFQFADLASYQALALAGFREKSWYLANGANLAYRKDMFLDLGGFQDIDGVASGDDVLLVQKAALSGNYRLHYLADPAARVLTRPQESWPDLLRQRMRWASKTASHVHRGLTWIHAGTFLYCGLILSAGILAFTGLLHPFWAVFGFFLKCALDAYLLLPLSRSFSHPLTLARLPVLEAIFLAYILVAGSSGLLGLSYDWKGRNVR